MSSSTSDLQSNWRHLHCTSIPLRENEVRLPNNCLLPISLHGLRITSKCVQKASQSNKTQQVQKTVILRYLGLLPLRAPSLCDRPSLPLAHSELLCLLHPAFPNDHQVPKTHFLRISFLFYCTIPGPHCLSPDPFNCPSLVSGKSILHKVTKII